MQYTGTLIRISRGMYRQLRKKNKYGFYFYRFLFKHGSPPFLEWFNAPFSPNPYLRRAKKFFKPND